MVSNTEELNAWKTVSQEKASRSPKTQLTYGQVIIATPSRFAALSNSGENGEEIEHEEGEIKDDVGSEYEGDGSITEVVNGRITGGENKGVRLNLPRQSKTNHKVIVDSSVQGREKNMGASKRSTRKNN